MTAVAGGKLAADLQYVEDRIAASLTLMATKHTVYTHGDQVAVEVEGSHWEARAWRAVFAGRILPSHVDRHGVRRQLVIAQQVQIEVVEHGRRRDEGGMTAGLMFVVACVGLFLWGWTHGSSRPNGAWIAAVAIVGAVVLLAATGLTSWRRADRRAKAYTASVERRLEAGHDRRPLLGCVMDKHDYGPLQTYEVIYTSGHVERVQAHQVRMPHDDFDLGVFSVRTVSKLEKRWTFHGEFDGHWQLVLSVPAGDVKSVRNVGRTADDLNGGA